MWINYQQDLKLQYFYTAYNNQQKKIHNPAFIIVLTALNLNEKLVLNRNIKHAVQSASFNAQEKREAGPARTRATSPAWQKISNANLQRKKDKKEKASATIERTRNQKREKE